MNIFKSPKIAITDSQTDDGATEMLPVCGDYTPTLDESTPVATTPVSSLTVQNDLPKDSIPGPPPQENKEEEREDIEKIPIKPKFFSMNTDQAMNLASEPAEESSGRERLQSEDFEDKVKLLPTWLVGVWKRKSIRRKPPGEEEFGPMDTDVDVTYIQSPYGFIDVRVDNNPTFNPTSGIKLTDKTMAFCGVTTEEQKFVSWHTCINYNPPLKPMNMTVAFKEAMLGTPLVTEDIGKFVHLTETPRVGKQAAGDSNTWQETDLNNTLEEVWEKVDDGNHNKFFAMFRKSKSGKTAFFVVVGTYFGYACGSKNEFCVGRIENNKWVIEQCVNVATEKKDVSEMEFCLPGQMVDWSVIDGTSIVPGDGHLPSLRFAKAGLPTSPTSEENNNLNAWRKEARHHKKLLSPRYVDSKASPDMKKLRKKKEKKRGKTLPSAIPLDQVSDRQAGGGGSGAVSGGGSGGAAGSANPIDSVPGSFPPHSKARNSVVSGSFSPPLAMKKSDSVPGISSAPDGGGGGDGGGKEEGEEEEEEELTDEEIAKRILEHREKNPRQLLPGVVESSELKEDKVQYDTMMRSIWLKLNNK